MTAKPMAEAGGASASPVSRPQRRGFLGGLVRRQDGDPGTALNYFLFGLNGVNSMRDNRREDEVLRMARQERELEFKHRDQVEQAIATLPPDQQVWARLNPEAFVRALAESQNDRNNGWNVGQGYSRAFRIRPDGTREDGAELPLRPRAPIMGYMIPGDSGDWEYSDE